MRWTQICMTALIALFMASPTMAQGLLDGDPLLEGQLEERGAAEKVAQVDPDEKLLAKVTEAQTRMEALVNKLGDAGQKFAAIEKGATRISARFVKAQDKYLEPHAKALEAYAEAHAAENEPVKKKLAKEIRKLRNKYLKKMKKISKASKKLEKKADKLQAKIDSGKAELSDDEDAKE